MIAYGNWKRHGIDTGTILAWLAAFSDSISLKGELALQYRAVVLYYCFGYVDQLAFILLSLT